MRQNLDGELVSVAKELLRLLADADAGRRAGENDCSCGQGGALGAEADQSGNIEDEIAARMGSCGQPGPRSRSDYAMYEATTSS